MNKKNVESKFDEVINGLVETLKETKSFVRDQAPDVAKQILAEREVEIRYELAKNIVALSAVISVFTLALSWPNPSEVAMVVRIIAGVGAAIMAIAVTECIFSNLKDGAMLKAAPKVYLLRVLRGFIK